MHTTDISTIKQEVKNTINHSDEIKINAINSMLIDEIDEMEGNWWDKASDAQKASISRGIKNMENGNTIPHDEMVKYYSKWLTK